MTRHDLCALLAARVAALPRPALAAVDGVDGVGKTVLADQLAEYLRAGGVPVVRVGIDGFHRPRAERYRRGRSSALGYYRDSFDLDAFRAAVVEPARRGEPVDGTPTNPADAANLRYVGGQRVYLGECAPEERADIVVDMTDPDAPVVLRS